MFQIPEPKLAKLKRSLESLILDGYAAYRELACLAVPVSSFRFPSQLALLLVYSLDRCTFLFSPGPRGMSRLPLPRPYC